MTPTWLWKVTKLQSLPRCKQSNQTSTRRLPSRPLACLLAQRLPKTPPTYPINRHRWRQRIQTGLVSHRWATMRHLLEQVSSTRTSRNEMKSVSFWNKMVRATFRRSAQAACPVHTSAAITYQLFNCATWTSLLTCSTAQTCGSTRNFSQVARSRPKSSST